MSDRIKPEDLPEYPLSEHELHRRQRAETGRTLLAGVLGGFASAVGYVVYSRLPEDQKRRLHEYLQHMLEARMNELRSSLHL